MLLIKGSICDLRHSDALQGLTTIWSITLVTPGAAQAALSASSRSTQERLTEVDRGQSTLIPVCLEDRNVDNNPVP
jgi:hypothetical protein